MPALSPARPLSTSDVDPVVMATATNVGCAHKQLTNRQVALGATAVVGLTLMVYLAAEQCNKGANYCDNSPNPTP